MLLLTTDVLLLTTDVLLLTSDVLLLTNDELLLSTSCAFKSTFHERLSAEPAVASQIALLMCKCRGGVSE